MFEPLTSTEYGCYFTGQVKTAVQFTYTIPLLVPFRLFARGLDAVRKWQGDMREVRALDNNQVSKRYQPNLSRHLKAEGNDFGGLHVHPHMMRACYMRLVLHLFDWGDHRDKRIAKYCLGHALGNTSDHYDHIRLVTSDLKYGRGSFGTFPVAEDELRRVEKLLAGEEEKKEQPKSRVGAAA